MEQLLGASVVTAALISRSAYLFSMSHAEIVERFGILNEGNSKMCYPNVQSECEDICKKMLKHLETTNTSGKTQSAFAMGKTRVFFRAGCLEHLESERSKSLRLLWDGEESWVYCSSTNYT